MLLAEKIHITAGGVRDILRKWQGGMEEGFALGLASAVNTLTEDGISTASERCLICKFIVLYCRGEQHTLDEAIALIRKAFAYTGRKIIDDH